MVHWTWILISFYSFVPFWIQEYVKNRVKVFENIEKQILDCYSSETIMTESPDEDFDSGQTSVIVQLHLQHLKKR